jgi:hypothetical protein
MGGAADVSADDPVVVACVGEGCVPGADAVGVAVVIGRLIDMGTPGRAVVVERIAHECPVGVYSNGGDSLCRTAGPCGCSSDGHVPCGAYLPVDGQTWKMWLLCTRSGLEALRGATTNDIL